MARPRAIVDPRVGKSEPLESLAREVGSFIRYWGFKEIHGRIWLHLYLSGESLDSSSLVKCLGASKALISISLKELQAYNVVLACKKTAQSTQSYRANTDIIGVILDVLKNRELVMMHRIEKAQKALSRDPKALKDCSHLCRKRLKNLGRFIGMGRSSLETFIGLGQIDFAEWAGVENEGG